MKQNTQAAQASDHPLDAVASTGDERPAQNGEYSAQRRETLAEAPGLRVRLLQLNEGQLVPWHYHSSITDTFFCMRGPMRILTRSPDASHTLLNGDTLAVPPGTAHLVEAVSADGCRFMIIQGVGEYDYVPVPDV
jgi:quercetin dioxygenase-like cupin family protein